MSERARVVLRVIDYGEYVSAWSEIPITERPAHHVLRVDGAWTGVRR